MKRMDATRSAQAGQNEKGDRRNTISTDFPLALKREFGQNRDSMRF